MRTKLFVNEFFYLDNQVKERIACQKPDFDAFGAIVFYRTYSRLVNNLQEQWCDVVFRVIEGVFSIRKDYSIKNNLRWDEAAAQAYAAKMAQAMFDMKWLPAGRGLWAMGTSFVYERGSMALNNCAYTKLGGNERLAEDFCWMMDALMLGVGVGFRAEREPLEIHKPIGTFEHYVLDSREGWCDLLRKLINAYLIPNRKKPNPHFDLVRPLGEPIKGFGGQASGPGPLKELYHRVDKWLRNGHETDVVRLKTDIANSIGTCVVAGNVRRSAELALGSVQDEVFMDLKDYDMYPEREDFGYMSNNSAEFYSDDDFELLGEVARRVTVRGEPGCVNLRNIQYARIGEPMNGLKLDMADGINPCQSASVFMLTPNGLRKLGQLTVGDLIWSQTGWTKIVKKWSTGIKKVFKYQTTAGSFEGTENHRIISNYHKIEVGKATTIDALRGPYKVVDPKANPQAILDGLVVGDGTVKAGETCLYIGNDDSELFSSEVAPLIFHCKDKNRYLVASNLQVSYTHERTVPEKYLNGHRQNVCSFLRGLYSANGSICGNRVTLKAASFKLIEQVQIMLSSIGIRSYFTTNKSAAVEHHNGTYVSRKSYDLNITIDRHKFAESIGFIQQYKMDKLNSIKVNSSDKKDAYDIISVEYLGEEEVFDITVDNLPHTYWCAGLNVSNCGEIPLEDKELCNVVETVPTRCTSHKDWLKACDYATFYSSNVSLLMTHSHETNAVLIRNRRIGVGIIDWTGWVHQESMHKVVKYMRMGYKHIRRMNHKYNSEMGVPDAIRVTTIKPGGTTPKLAKRTPGMGYPTFRETLRRIRIAVTNPIKPYLDSANIPFEPCYDDPNGTHIYAYPTVQGPAPPAEEITLWEQAMNLVAVQRHWADNSVSNTLYFKPKWRLDFSRSYALGDDKERDYIAHEALIEHDIVMPKAELLKAQGDKLLVDYDTKTKIKFRVNKWNFVEVSLYHFDPNHEEDEIEKVLSLIVPNIKACSLLPHTAKGAYRQMPEEGLTPTEYAERIATISEIDWAGFTGSDGEAEKYCQGASCVLPIYKNLPI